VSSKRKYAVFSILAVIAIVLDQWTKILARQSLRDLGTGKKVIVEGYFDLRYSENPGVAFGLFQNLAGGRIILSVMAVVALVLVFQYLRKTEDHQKILHVALGLIGGGAIGNVLDRVLYGRVTDFIVWRYKQHEWPAFNVADAALVIGVGFIFIDMLKNYKQTTPPTQPQAGGESA
jgi:signal peptidase II